MELDDLTFILEFQQYGTGHMWACPVLDCVDLSMSTLSLFPYFQ